MNKNFKDPIMLKLRNLAHSNAQKYPSANKKEIASRVARQFRFSKKEIERLFKKWGSKFFIDDYEFFCLEKPKKKRH